ncbi:unnamed protein product, partial [Discosporangium mesarthrocarpum]
YKQLEYKLVDSEGDQYTEKGAYIIIDGGYQASITQAKWSERLESVRKDVECFFGSTKGCWRIPKLLLQYWHRKRTDNILLSCCILQNVPHAYDGLAEVEVNTDWTGDAGLHDAFYIAPYTDFLQ